MLESGETSIAPQDPAPLTKRSRKILNCEPCRNSKLKCDRCDSGFHPLSMSSVDGLIAAIDPARLACSEVSINTFSTPPDVRATYLVRDLTR
jgi:hypothetical protein